MCKMTKCAAYRCPNRNEAGAKSKGITFHRLPRYKPDILLKWIVNMKRKNWIPSKRNLLCSDHFTSDCFIKRRHRSFLKEDAVPTLFKTVELSKKNVCSGRTTGMKRKKSNYEDTLAQAKQLRDDFIKQFLDADTKQKAESLVKSRQKLDRVDTAAEVDLVVFRSGDEKPTVENLPRNDCILPSQPPPLSENKEQEINGVCDIENNFSHHLSRPDVQHHRKVIQKTRPPVDPSELKSNNLDSLLNSLCEQRLLCSYGLEILQAFGEFPKRLLKLEDDDDWHLLCTDDGVSELRKFSTVLYLSSPVAYRVVSEIFRLPTLTELRDCLKAEGFGPGFTSEALAVLRIKAYESTSNQICSIMLDYVSIKEQCVPDGSCEKYFGFVNLGGGQEPLDTDELPLATKALVYTAVGLGRDWKLPFGYFLCKDLSGEILRNVTEEAICALEECGLRVRALVCSGLKCFIRMGELFGCKVRSRKTTGKRVIGKKFVGITTHFPHPFDSSRKIFMAFGIRHSLKLLRSLLADKGSLLSTVYGVVDWKYFKQLKNGVSHAFPENTCPANADYIKFRHLQKIIYLCQSNFNSSVSSALELAGELKLNGFADVEMTASFASDVQRAFELLNSRNPITAEEKPSICLSTFEEQAESMTDIADRLINMESIMGRRITEEGRWTSVTLVAFTLVSVSQLAAELLGEKALRYFSTYRIDLDHWDMVLSSLQRLGGWDDVPSALEFCNSYRKLLEKSSENAFHNYDFEGEDLTVGQGEIYLYRSPSSLMSHHRFNDSHNMQSHFATDLMADTLRRALFVVRYVSKRLSCPECVAVMLSEGYASCSNSVNVNYVNLKPSRYIMKILKTSECVLKVKLAQSSYIVKEHLVSSVFREYSTLCDNLGLPENLFYHFTEEPYHVICLTKVVIRTIITFKLHKRKRLRNGWL